MDEHHHAAHETAAPASRAGHAGHELTTHGAASHDTHTMHSAAEHSAAEHSAHTDHTGHELLFRNRFWVCLVLSIPVLHL